jgi:two-component sensor histidine kinase
MLGFDELGARWETGPGGARVLRSMTRTASSVGVALAADSRIDLDVRTRALRLGLWVGWLSLGVVLAALALDRAAAHRLPLVALTLAAAAANGAAMRVPWRRWLVARRGRLLLDLWSGGLLGFVGVLVVAGGASFTLLLFLVAPFIAVVQRGVRRGVWLAAGAATCALATALVPLQPGATAMRLALVAAVVGVALLLARAIAGEIAAHRAAAERAELEHTLVREANHRITNDLQTAADLLLLARPDGAAARAFDDTAARIRSIATVHRLLTERDGPVDAGELLRGIAAGAPVPVAVEADAVTLDAATAQRLGIVANELLTNAFRHGAPPLVVRLGGGAQTRLRVDDAGGGAGGAGGTGLGLQLVRLMTEQGLRGRFALGDAPAGGTRAEVVFPEASPCAS